jgi:RNA 3'-terminal phosphate cyclase (ATP)
MFTVDGSRGEGGGQLVRSSLAISLLTGKSLTIENIRAGRRRPGLMRQHLAAVRAAAQISRGAVEGADVGSRRLVFRPDRSVAAGQYTFRVGTAGSASLVLQTILPALLTADGRSQLTLEGGTHNPWAPPFDFLAKSFVPLVNRMGPVVKLLLRRPGFYPAGGGCMVARIEPCESLRGFDLLDRGKLLGHEVRAVVSALPRHIAERECQQIARKTGWPKSSFHVQVVDDPVGPGNVVLIESRFENVAEVFTGFGRLGVKAEQVAMEAWNEANAYLQSAVPVGPHLADQLLLIQGLAAYLGGQHSSFRTTPLTKHSTTHIDLLRQLLDIAVQIEPGRAGDVTVHLAPAGTLARDKTQS